MNCGQEPSSATGDALRARNRLFAAPAGDGLSTASVGRAWTTAAGRHAATTPSALLSLESDEFFREAGSEGTDPGGLFFLPEGIGRV